MFDILGYASLNPITGYVVFKPIVQTPGVASDNYQLNANGVNTQSGTSYTLSITDNGRIIAFTNSSAVTVTVPSILEKGFSCSIVQYGTGQVAVSAGSGVTLRLRGSANKTSGQYAVMSLISVVNKEHVVTGDVTF